MKRIYLFGLSIVTGILLALGWAPTGFAPLLLIAFVPLLIAENYVYKNKLGFSNIFVFNLAFTAFVVWNTLTTFWIYNSTFFGAVAAIFLNTLFQSIVFLLFHITKCKLSANQGNYALIAYWIAFEYLHLDWDLSWSWLTLGNGFAGNIKFIQWYEFTGVFGGTLWIIILNIFVYKWFYLKYIDRISKSNLFLYIALLFAFIPITISHIIYYNYNEKINPINIVVVQPNIDPYNDKFDALSPEEQLSKMIKLSKQKIDSNTQFLVLPETAIPEGVWEEELGETRSIDSLLNLVKLYPNLKVITGASTNKMIIDGNINKASARKFRDENYYYEAYNSSLLIENNQAIQIYHKTKLVTGVEKMPFANYLRFMEKLALDLGGTIGSLGIQTNRTPFVSKSDSIKVAPVICYESIFGEFVSKYVANGAQFIAIETNDGWWGDTPGYRQHCSYASLRAIETRRGIARSANTGISCFVNQRGEILQATKWWKDDVIKGTINANNKLTFYVKHGDYIGRLMGLVAILLFSLTLITSFRQYKK